jgi:predicted metalloprotease
MAIGGGGGCGLLLLLVAGMLMGVDPLELLSEMPTIETEVPQFPTESGSMERQELVDENAQFVAVVLADTEDVWNDLFQRAGARYQEPTLVLFTQMDRSACGFAQAAVGPFYCPADRSVYIDLSFYDDLRSRFGAPGDFAQAYVIAHEVGHHVQNLLGVSEQAQELQSRLGRAEANAVSVRVELQADCYAGVWAHHAQRMQEILETGDVEEALRAASAIGDDRIQSQSQGRVVPDSFTHGSSAQRQRWFTTGLETGSVEACDTFSVADV